MSTFYDEWYENSFEYALGDINQDNSINILDIIELVNAILNGNMIGIGYYLSDLNGDGILNIQDLIALVNVILNATIDVGHPVQSQQKLLNHFLF